MSKGLKKLAEAAKLAATPPPDQLRRELAQKLMSLAGAGLGLGAGARGLMELRNMLQPDVSIPFVSPGPSTLPVPVLKHEEEEPLDGAPPLFKAAEEPGMLASIRDRIADLIPTSLDPAGVTNYLSHHVSEPGALPAAIPLTMATGAAAAGGGYALSDWLFKRRRQQQMQSELDRAKADYQQALVDQHLASKHAAQAGPYGQLDALYDQLQPQLEKQANLADPAGKLSGMYLALLGLTAAASGAGAYNWAKNRSPTALTNKAMKERARQLWARSPQPVYAVPQPIAIPSQPAA